MNVLALCLMVLCVPVFADEICATAYSELERSENLKSLKPLFSADKRIAMVNETKGSYVIIDAFDDHLSISFFTSGLFDLYPIRKDGPLKFCDDGVSLHMIGLGKEDKFVLKEGGFQMGKGGPRMNFARGEMPALLRKLHKIDPRGLASEGR